MDFYLENELKINFFWVAKIHQNGAQFFFILMRKKIQFELSKKVVAAIVGIPVVRFSWLVI